MSVMRKLLIAATTSAALAFPALVGDASAQDETVYVLESFHKTPRAQIAEAMRSLIVFESIVCVDTALLLGAVGVYESVGIDVAEADLVGCAETTGVGRIASFDRSIDRVDTLQRIEPPRA